MTAKLTPSVGEMLNARWHDRSLDLQTLKFDEANRECSFLVLELCQESAAEGKLLQKRRLCRRHVTVKNVTSVQISGAEGEVELYIENVRATPGRFWIKCVNGVVELLGQGLELSMEETRANASQEAEVRLATPIGEVSWQKKETKPKP
jgi:hypothetical protein